MTPDRLTGNSSGELFCKRIVLLTQLADVEHEIAKDAWHDGHLSDGVRFFGRRPGFCFFFSLRSASPPQRPP
jgi:hypothetical protein